MTKKSLLFFALVFSFIICANASEMERINDSIRVFNLGEVTCVGFTAMEGVNTMNAESMSDHDARKVDEALSLLPGLSVRDAGARAEGKFYMRGFDQRRVPVMLDGVPIYIPYEAQLDIRRLSTSNLSKITVEKGAPSLLCGINAMGGTVNLVSAKPSDRFELRANASTLWNANIGLGTASERWYAQANFAYDKRDYIRLPHTFKPIEGVQESNHLLNSDREDATFNVRVGVTPGDDEYAIAYSMIRANKGVPVYLGDNGKRRFWRYDPWDKDEVLFHTRTVASTFGILESRVYYDRYYNVVRSYDDISCTTQDSKSAFNSTYDDYSLGAMVSWYKDVSYNNLVKIGINYKRDVHRSHDGEPVDQKSDNLMSIAAEDQWSPIQNLHITSAIGVFAKTPVNKDTEVNYHIAAIYDLSSTEKIKLSLARTSRFATLSERYTYKFGKSIPNPDLNSEHSYNMDLTAYGNTCGLSWNLSGFCSFLGDVIQDVTGVDPDNPTVFQPRNCGKARFIGWEAALSYKLFGCIKLSGNYSYIYRVNTTDRELKFTDVPRHKGVISADLSLPCDIMVNADWILSSSAYSTSDGSLSTPGYGIVNMKAGKTFLCDSLSVEIGVKNLFDKLYYYTEGYPQEGRLVFAALHYNFKVK